MQEEWVYFLKNEFDSKKYERDMVWDYCNILSHRLSFFSKNIDEYEQNRAENSLKNLLPFSNEPVAKYRMYIFAGIQFVSFAWIDIDADILSKVYSALKSEFELCDVMPAQLLDPNLVSTVYLLDGKDIILIEHIYPSHLTWLLQSLSKFNLIKQRML